MSQAAITSYNVVKGGHIEPDEENIVIGTDEDGDPIPPESVGDYRRVGGKVYGRSSWAVPIGIEEGTVGEIPVKRPVFYVVELQGFRGKDVVVGTTTAPREKIDATDTVATDLPEKEAIKTAVDWMLDTPIKAQFDVPTRSLTTEPLPRKLETKIDWIRAGSQIAIPHVEGHFEALHGLDVKYWEDSFLLKHSDSGGLYRLLAEKIGISDVQFHLQPLGGIATPIADVSVSNEHNLRDDVATDCYNRVKSHEGELMAHLSNGTLPEFTATRIETVRDGFVNPTDDDSLKPSERNSGTYIDESESDRWVPLNETVQAAVEDENSYIVTTDGLYSASDNYLLSQIVEADQIGALGDAFENVEPVSLDNYELSNSIEEPSEPPSPESPLTELPHVGPARSERIFAETIGETIKAGLPFFEVPSNGQQQILDTIHAMDPPQRFGTTAKMAVLGMLGGVGHTVDGEPLGTIASLLTDSFDLRRMEWAWFAEHHGIKREYRASIDETPSFDAFQIGIGTPETGNIQAHLEASGHEVCEYIPRETRPPTTDIDTVAIGDPETDTWMDLPTDLFDFTAHALNTDYTEQEILESHVTLYHVQRDTHTAPFLEFRHPETNTVAVIAPEKSFSRARLSFEQWTPWEEKSDS